jgi:hypothetical protein
MGGYESYGERQLKYDILASRPHFILTRYGHNGNR